MKNNGSNKRFLGLFPNAVETISFRDWQPCSMVLVYYFSSANNYYLLWCFKCVKLAINDVETVISVSTICEIIENGRFSSNLVKYCTFVLSQWAVAGKVL